jgi:hypothetical protein
MSSADVIGGSDSATLSSRPRRSGPQVSAREGLSRLPGSRVAGVSHEAANIDILLQEVGGETVPQCVWRHALLDPRGLGDSTGQRGRAGGPTAARPGCGRETTSLPVAAGCAAVRPATRRAAVRAAAARASRDDPYAPCRVRRAAACARNRCRQP